MVRVPTQPHYQVALAKSALFRRLAHPAERFVSEDQLVSVLRRGAERGCGDFAVRPAYAEQQTVGQ